MSADGTPDPTPILAHVETNQAPGMFAPTPEKTWCYSGGEPWPCSTVRAAVIAATPRDELLAALTADGTLEWRPILHEPGWRWLVSDEWKRIEPWAPASDTTRDHPRVDSR